MGAHLSPALLVRESLAMWSWEGGRGRPPVTVSAYSRLLVFTASP
jgi:hypothetical protein